MATTTGDRTKMQISTAKKPLSIRALAVAILGAALASLALAGSAPAKEVELHLFDRSFDGSDAVGAPKFSASSLQKLDVDKATGNVYVASTTGTVYKFDANGVSQPFSALAPNTVLSTEMDFLGDLEVDNSGTETQGRFYTLKDYGPTKAWDPSGEAPADTNFPLSGGGEQCGAAVDASGHLWRHSWNSVVTEFDAGGSSTGTTVNISPSGFCDFDMDAAGNFYVPSSYGGGPTSKYDSSGNFLYTVDNGISTASAADYSNNDVYIDVGTRVNHYTSTGEFVSSFGTPEGSYPGIVGSGGIAVNPVDHSVYVISNGPEPRIDKFLSTGLITIADVTTEDPSELTRSTAKLHGTLNPDGVDTTECEFEWGPGASGSYPNSAPCDQGNAFTGSSDVAVTASLPTLTGGTTYHYRLSVTNAEGKSNGDNVSFDTVSAVKDTITLPPTNITRTSATIHGSFDADGFETSYWFEWGVGCCGSVGNKIPVSPVNAGTPVGAFEVSENLTGLTKGTTYRYRLVATNELGETKSPIREFQTVGNVKGVATLTPSPIGYDEATLRGQLDPDGYATNYWFEIAKLGGNYDRKVPAPVPPGGDAGSAPGLIEVTTPLTGLEPGQGYYVRMVAENELGQTTAPFPNGEVFFETKQAVKAVTTLPATDVHLTSATLHGSLDPDGLPTTYYFEWGPSVAYGGYAPAVPPGAPAGEAPGSVQFSAPVEDLEPGVTYHFRMVGVNVHGKSVGGDMTFTANDAPEIINDTVSQVNTDGAIMEAEVNANALSTNWRFEYGPEPCSISTCTQSPQKTLFGNTVPKPVSFQVTGFEAGEKVYFRLVATNARGTTTGEDRHFITYLPDPGTDACDNSQVRQQSGAALLLDCRAYELVSAANAGGYDVESDLIPGQEPLVAYPEADDRVLYALHQGMVPGATGSPTNYGRDPYIASRDPESGWSTAYVGLPADGMEQIGAFGSPLLGADSQLGVFAFGGEGICDPCFADGSTNVPLRLSDGRLIPGMAGGANPPGDPGEYVAKPLSDDGRHFVFGSASVYAPGGDAAGSIYDRDLVAGTTQLVSTTETGAAIAGGDVGALDVSADGSRIVVAKQVDEDSEGNRHWRPYLHLGTGAGSVPLAPGTTSGVLFAGMTDDGEDVFFTTVDELLPADGDESADLYRSHVGPGGGPAVLSLLSGGSNSDGCDPAANGDGENWNAVGASSGEDCGVVSIGGGGGVAGGSGAIYFLSPEALDGEGTAGEPNLFAIAPGGTAEHVATLEPDNPLVLDSVADNEIHRYGDFQTSGNGEFAVFDSDLDLTSFQSRGHTQIFRYELGGDALICASCAPSGAAPISDSPLPNHGLAVTDDGRVFFSSAEAFVLRDTNEVKDAYEFSDLGAEPVTQLISTGGSLEDSGMLSVTPDGEDAFFFTRQVLVATDGNGSTVKIYDARENGGFLFDPPPHPCAASDECHGAGTTPPGPPNINSQTGSGVTPPVVKPPKPKCKKGFVKRHGKCVKKKKKKHKKKGKHKKRNANKGRG